MLPASSSDSVFIVKYDSSGNALKVKTFNSINSINGVSPKGFSVRLDSLNYLYLVCGLVTTGYNIDMISFLIKYE